MQRVLLARLMLATSWQAVILPGAVQSGPAIEWRPCRQQVYALSSALVKVLELQCKVGTKTDRE